ncbi:MAG: hypothetical protein V8S38_04835 [Lachnospiraceae bacterium]
MACIRHLAAALKKLGQKREATDPFEVWIMAASVFDILLLSQDLLQMAIAQWDPAEDAYAGQLQYLQIGNRMPASVPWPCFIRKPDTLQFAHI